MIETVSAHAKLTLSLAIVGVRADGFHIIDAEMVTLDLADTVTIDPDGSGLTADGPYCQGVPLDDTNLISRALGLCNRQAGIHVRKTIPHGGGLGGGSADAAAVLCWAGFTDLTAAARLGADIAFCVVGGRARVGGIGEIITPLVPIRQHVTLIIPPLSCSTPLVYRAWDHLGGPRSSGQNDLEAAALLVEPRLEAWRDRIREAVGTAPTLAGSGATWFVMGHRPELVDALPDARVVLTSTCPNTCPNTCP